MVYDTLNPQILRLILKDAKDGAKILDVGCGTGNLGRELKGRISCFLTGIEIDRASVNLAKEVYDETYIIDLEMIINGLEKLPNAKLYDYLIMGDVLEHVSKPEILLTYLSQFLKKDGFLIVSPPNVANWMIRLKLLFGQFDYNGGILDTGHLKFFTFKTAKRLLDGCGYEITACANNNTTKLFSFLGRYWKSMFAFQFVFKCVHK